MKCLDFSSKTLIWNPSRIKPNLILMKRRFNTTVVHQGKETRRSPTSSQASSIRTRTSLSLYLKRSSKTKRCLPSKNRIMSNNTISPKTIKTAMEVETSISNRTMGVINTTTSTKAEGSLVATMKEAPLLRAITKTSTRMTITTTTRVHQMGTTSRLSQLTNLPTSNSNPITMVAK